MKKLTNYFFFKPLVCVRINQSSHIFLMCKVYVAATFNTVVLAWNEPPKHKLFLFNYFQLYLAHQKYV